MVAIYSKDGFPRLKISSEQAHFWTKHLQGKWTKTESNKLAYKIEISENETFKVKILDNFTFYIQNDDLIVFD